jgi:hypothetical protein
VKSQRPDPAPQLGDGFGDDVALADGELAGDAEATNVGSALDTGSVTMAAGIGSDVAQPVASSSATIATARIFLILGRA